MPPVNPTTAVPLKWFQFDRRFQCAFSVFFFQILQVVNKIPIKNVSFLFLSLCFSSAQMKCDWQFCMQRFSTNSLVALVNIRVSIAASLAQMFRSRNAIRNHRLAVKWLFVMAHKQLYQFITSLSWVFSMFQFWHLLLIMFFQAAIAELMSFIGIIECFELILVLRIHKPCNMHTRLMSDECFFYLNYTSLIHHHVLMTCACGWNSGMSISGGINIIDNYYKSKIEFDGKMILSGDIAISLKMNDFLKNCIKISWAFSEFLHFFPLFQQFICGE